LAGERLGVIIKGESKAIVDLRKNIVLVSLIVRVDGWGKWYLWKKKKLLRNLKSNQKGWDKPRGFSWSSPDGSTSTWSECIATFEWLVTKSNSISAFT